ncbi:hypothetical protein DUNSADRAFT_1361 [Dunaliella salina]|uniref:Uncharacterized protein n=1 Tax=Dunaliella salina TaxID=3046 RepID=A0ABQ7FXL9_DUNSA|nr:hypothetical protein DUNSADRAFT_1361 [Dunaliella salina]|eukprot:KAF5827094.1 hypothetical protein DUNSADRAFT_1361 [Dunaliella salina]
MWGRRNWKGSGVTYSCIGACTFAGHHFLGIGYQKPTCGAGGEVTHSCFNVLPFQSRHGLGVGALLFTTGCCNKSCHRKFCAQLSKTVPKFHGSADLHTLAKLPPCCVMCQPAEPSQPLKGKAALHDFADPLTLAKLSPEPAGPPCNLWGNAALHDSAEKYTPWQSCPQGCVMCRPAGPSCPPSWPQWCTCNLHLQVMNLEFIKVSTSKTCNCDVQACRALLFSIMASMLYAQFAPANDRF